MMFKCHRCRLVDVISPDELCSMCRGVVPGRFEAHVPIDAATRKSIPLCTGCLDYFPDALLEVAELSRIGNDQHNPGQSLHWAKEKSTDEADALMRHQVDRGKRDVDGVRHSTKVAWRALAQLQREIEAERTPFNGLCACQLRGQIHIEGCPK